MRDEFYSTASLEGESLGASLKVNGYTFRGSTYVISFLPPLSVWANFSRIESAPIGASSFPHLRMA